MIAMLDRFVLLCCAAMTAGALYALGHGLAGIPVGTLRSTALAGSGLLVLLWLLPAGSPRRR